VTRRNTDHPALAGTIPARDTRVSAAGSRDTAASAGRAIRLT